MKQNDMFQELRAKIKMSNLKTCHENERFQQMNIDLPVTKEVLIRMYDVYTQLVASLVA